MLIYQGYFGLIFHRGDGGEVNNLTGSSILSPFSESSSFFHRGYRKWDTTGSHVSDPKICQKVNAMCFHCQQETGFPTENGEDGERHLCLSDFLSALDRETQHIR